MCSASFDLEPYRVHNILHTYGDLDVKIAWEMEGEEMQLPLKDVEHVLSEQAWEGASPFEAAADDPHWGLVLEADLSYPIIVVQEVGMGDLTVVDGRHRVMKAWLLGEEFIAVKKLDYDCLVELATISAEVSDRSRDVADVLQRRDSSTSAAAAW